MSLASIFKALENFRIAPLETTKNLQPTFYEVIFNLKDTQRIIKRQAIDGTQTNINVYTVPVGYTLFIISAYVAINNDGLGSGAAHLILNNIQYLDLGVQPHNNIALPLTFSIPHRVDQKEFILISGEGDASVNIYCGFTGFLVKNTV